MPNPHFIVQNKYALYESCSDFVLINRYTYFKLGVEETKNMGIVYKYTATCCCFKLISYTWNNF